MSLKTIQMDPTHLKVSKQKKTKKVIVPPSVMINQPNLRQILLDKLMKHRKTQKRNDPSPSILSNNFDEQCSFSSPTPIPVPDIPIPISEPLSTILQDKPYGVLKNGLKPTFKTWNKSQKNIQPIVSVSEPQEQEPVYIPRVEVIPVEMVVEPKPVETPIKIEPVMQKTPIKIGKSKKNKTVQIWIACNKTRKQRSEDQENIRKTNLNTVKNYLKHNRLIKVGTTAPTNLLRQIYENAKSYGDVMNENKQNLLHNYEKDSE
jgi:hypothetical protein